MAAASDPGETRAAESMPARQLDGGGKEKPRAGGGRREGQRAVAVEAKVVCVKQRRRGG
jgi:hypothetical protein